MLLADPPIDKRTLIASTHAVIDGVVLAGGVGAGPSA